MCLLKLIILFIVFGKLVCEKHVMLLSDTNFQKAMIENEVVLVMFYAPWCWHSAKLKPTFEIAAEELLKNNPPIPLGEVDCTHGGRITCKEQNIDVYPHLKIFRNGIALMDYFGPREVTSIVTYMKSVVPSKPKELKNVREFKQQMKSDEVCLIGFFVKDAYLKSQFLKLFDKLKDQMCFAYTSEREVLQLQGVQDRLALYRPACLRNKFEENFDLFIGKPELSEMRTFIKNHYHGLVGVRTNENREDFTLPLITVYHYIDFKNDKKNSAALRDKVLEVAVEFSDKYKFAVSNRDDFPSDLYRVGIDAKRIDRPVAVVRDKHDKTYIFDDNKFTAETFRNFLQKVSRGKATPYVNRHEL